MDTQTLPALLAPFRTRALTDACGVSRNAVADWRKGITVPRDAATLSALADLLKVDAKELLDVIASKAAA